MISISKGEINTLIRLQEIELEVVAIKNKLNAIPDRLVELDAKLADSKKKIEEKETILDELDKAYRAYEADAQVYLAKKAKSQEKLRSVKTNKEYQSSLKEIEDLENLHSKVEDQMLECLESMDSEKDEVQQKKEKFERFSKQINTEKETIQNDSKAIRKTLDELDQKRAQVADKLSTDLYHKYCLTKKMTGGIALAGVVNSVCQGCNVNIPPQLYNELQRLDKLLCCPHCERILYPLSVSQT